MKTIILMLVLAAAATACTTNNNKNAASNKGENEMKVIALTKADFLQKVYNFEANPQEWKFEGDKPAIVDFYATWCGPCKALAPTLEELAAEYDGQINIYKIDVDQEKELASAFGVSSIPTLLFISQNELPQLSQGALPKSKLKEIIADYLLK